MTLMQVNLWAVLCSTASAFVIGAAWYSVLAKPWSEVSGRDASVKRPPGLVYPSSDRGGAEGCGQDREMPLGPSTHPSSPISKLKG